MFLLESWKERFQVWFGFATSDSEAIDHWKKSISWLRKKLVVFYSIIDFIALSPKSLSSSLSFLSLSLSFSLCNLLTFISLPLWESNNIIPEQSPTTCFSSNWLKLDIRKLFRLVSKNRKIKMRKTKRGRERERERKALASKCASRWELLRGGI